MRAIATFMIDQFMQESITMPFSAEKGWLASPVGVLHEWRTVFLLNNAWHSLPLNR